MKTMQTAKTLRLAAAAILALSLAACATFPTSRSASSSAKIFTVSQAPDATYHTVQSAIDAVPHDNTTPTTILIEPGIYPERVTLPKDKPHLTLKGADPYKTIITCSVHANMLGSDGKPLGTFNTNTVRIEAPDTTVENLTFENTAGNGGDIGQALALSAVGDRQVYRNCRLLGWQDTLYANSGRQYYDHCYIEGRVDFIFGNAVAVFDHCQIHSRNGGHVTAAAHSKDQPFGYVFLHCKLTGDGAAADLGRPWRDYANVAYMYCDFGPHIKPEGWQNWHDTHRDQTARYSEYKDTGPGADRSARLPWTHELTDAQAAKYTLANILGGGDGWRPQGDGAASSVSAGLLTPVVAWRDVTDFGAKDDDRFDSTQYIQAAINAAGTQGGGTVLVPPGTFVTGSLFLRSNVTLDLAPGATLLGSEDINDYPLWRSNWEGRKVPPRHASIFAGEGLSNVTITGRGTVDGRGYFWWHRPHDGVAKSDLRPYTFRLIDSKNILISGITIHNSPMWTLTPLACDNVTIDHVTIQNPYNSPNTDGINPESCSNVHISNSYIDVGDDCVTIKSGTEEDGRQHKKPCENLTITNCTMVHGHGGVVIGSEMSGGVRNVVISNCVFTGTDRGLRFKSRRGRGGVVQDVRADNIIMDGVITPIVMNLYYAPGARGAARLSTTAKYSADASTPAFERLCFSNITAKNIRSAPAFILGLPEMPIRDVTLDNVTFILDPANTTPAKPDMADDIKPVARGGIFAKWTTGLTLNNVTVANQNGPAVTVVDSSHLTIDALRNPTPPATQPAVLLTNTPDAVLRNVPHGNGAGANEAVAQ